MPVFRVTRSFLSILMKAAGFNCKRLQNDSALNIVQYFTLYSTVSHGLCYTK